MRYCFLLLCVIASSCTGSLSEEQRKRIRESMEQGEIKKLSDAEITHAAFQFGRQIDAIMEAKDPMITNPELMDSLSKVYSVEIVSLQRDSKQLREVERQIVEAYSNGGGSGDNVQKMGADSLLYTKPVLREHPDGSTEFIKAIGIRMTRKQVVLSIKD